MRTVVADVVGKGRFTPVASYQRFAYVCAGLLVASGLVHLGVYAVDGGPWEGGDRILDVCNVMNPDKLRHVRLPAR